MPLTEGDDPHSNLVAALRVGTFPEAEIAELIEDVKKYVWTEHEPMRQEADVIAGRAVAVAYQNIASFRGDSRFLTWVIGIAKKLVKKTAAQWQRQPATVSLDAISVATDRELAAQAILARRETEDEQLVAWEIRAAVDELPEKHREIFRLRVEEQLPAAEVATMIGESPENIRQIQCRNCARIREKLRACGWDTFRKARGKATAHAAAAAMCEKEVPL